MRSFFLLCTDFCAFFRPTSLPPNLTNESQTLSLQSAAKFVFCEIRRSLYTSKNRLEYSIHSVQALFISASKVSGSFALTKPYFKYNFHCATCYEGTGYVHLAHHWRGYSLSKPSHPSTIFQEGLTYTLLRARKRIHRMPCFLARIVLM